MQPAQGDSWTPWSAPGDIRAVEVSPIRTPIDATILIPGSKSISNRALIIAAMAEGRTRLTGLLRSDDTYWCVDALKRLGVDIEEADDGFSVDGIGRRRPRQGPIYVGSAGTVARFLPPILAAGDPGVWQLTASAQMSKRPISTLFDAMMRCGAQLEFEGVSGAFPFTLTGASFSGGSVTLSGATSSQFISALLIAGAQARDGVDLHIEDDIVQSDYVRITMEVMRHFGAKVDVDEKFRHFQVQPTGFHARDYAVEADASTATYFAALAAARRGRLTIANLSRATRQPDFGFFATLERLGSHVSRCDTHTTVTGRDGLRGGFAVDMRANSDASLTLAAIAPFADGPITIQGIGHIRHQESDRIAAMCSSLRALRVPVQEDEDGLTIFPARPQFATVDSFDDHRIAMSLAVLGAIGQGVEIVNPICVSKTCPNFFELIGTLGVQWRGLN
jgi:3-phosphoshikimate 1-carboxyvinyltransferase